MLVMTLKNNYFLLLYLSVIFAEMDGTMPVSLLSRRSRNKSAAAVRWSNAGAAVMRNKPFFGEFELKERV